MNAIIVDDERLCAEYLEDMLSGVEDVEVSGCFQEVGRALFFMRDTRVDLVFLDIEMPQVNGIEACRRMKELNPDICVIFVTGYDQYALDAFKEAAVSYLLKPCSREELLQAISRARRLLAVPAVRVQVRTFGHFAVFIDGKPCPFSNRKAKELLAVAVDWKGSGVTMEQAVDLLWEDRPYDDSVKQLYRKAVSYLRQFMKVYQVDFIDIGRGQINIIPTRVDCDYYRLLDGDPEARKLFEAGGGLYMSEYSWGENSLAGIERILRKEG